MTRFSGIRASPVQSMEPAYFLSFLLDHLVARFYLLQLPWSDSFLYAAAPTDDVILTTKSIDPKADNSKEVDEFQLSGRQCIWCKSLAKQPKYTEQ